VLGDAWNPYTLHEVFEHLMVTTVFCSKRIVTYNFKDANFFVGDSMIDTSDIRELTQADFARGQKNPFAESLRKNGYRIIIDVTPEDIAAMSCENVNRINDLERMDWLELDEEEIQAMKMYRKSFE